MGECLGKPSTSTRISDELWPKLPFTDPETGAQTFCPNNGERRTGGTTPAGSTWTYRETSKKDAEDNGSSYVFTLEQKPEDGGNGSGDVFEVKHFLSSDRDSSHTTKKVFHRGSQVFDSDSSAFRDAPRKGTRGASEAGPLEVALRQVAEKEGVTADELRAALPKMCSV